MLRRHILGVTAAALPAALLAACSISSSNGVTTFTLDVAKVDQDASAMIQAVSSVLALPGIGVALGPNLVVVQTALAAAQAALASFDQATHGKATVDIDTTSAKSFVNSLVADIQTVIAGLQPVVGKLAGSLQQQVSIYLTAIQTLIPFVLSAIDLASATPAKALKLPMTEAQALQAATH